MSEIKLLKTDEDDLIENDFAILKANFAEGWKIAGFTSRRSLRDVETYRILLVREDVQKKERTIAITEARATE